MTPKMQEQIADMAKMMAKLQEFAEFREDASRAQFHLEQLWLKAVQLRAAKQH